MRWFKLFTTALLIAVVVLFVRQNLTTFQMSLPFTLDLYITAPARWTQHLYGIIFISGLLGLLIGLLIPLKAYFRLRRTLNERHRDHRDKPVKRSLIHRGRPAVEMEKEASEGATSKTEAEPESPSN